MKVAIYGRTGAGKSYVAGLIAEMYAYQVCSSGQLCRAISMMLLGEESKQSLNLISTKMREIDPAIWINSVLRSTSARDNFVFDSVRYMSDYRYFKKNDFKLLKVIANDELIANRLDIRGQVIEDQDKRHPSEVELEGEEFDATIVNARDRAAVQRQIRSIFEPWL